MKYISIKIEPNGKIPPRIEITAGSMNQRFSFVHLKNSGSTIFYFRHISPNSELITSSKPSMNNAINFKVLL